MPTTPSLRSAPLSEAQIARITAAGVPIDEVSGNRSWIACLEATSLPPTDPELAMLRSYIEFVVHKAYNPSAAARILSDQFATGHNSAVLRKDADSWRYSRYTWTTPRFPRYNAPGNETLYPNLVDLLDKIEDLLPDLWETWKAEHASVFAASATR